MKRYEVHEGSDTMHCCFEATVVDRDRDRVSSNAISESMQLDDAEMIADALNDDAREKLERIKALGKSVTSGDMKWARIRKILEDEEWKT